MRRVLVVILVLAGAGAGAGAGAYLLTATGAKQESGNKFTVEFDNAFGLVKGGDVKVVTSPVCGSSRPTMFAPCAVTQSVPALSKCGVCGSRVPSGRG